MIHAGMQMGNYLITARAGGTGFSFLSVSSRIRTHARTLSESNGDDQCEPLIARPVENRKSEKE